MADWLVVQLLAERLSAKGARRAAAVALLKTIRQGIKLSGNLDRVLADMALELGEDVAEQARDICRKLGLCN